MKGKKFTSAGTGRQSVLDRGGAWVGVQLVILLCVALAPFVLERKQPGLGALNPTLASLGLITGLAGMALVMVGVTSLGRNATAFPKPMDDGHLVDTGVYGVVRHPIYAGLLLASAGWSMLWASPSAAALTLVLGLFFDRKSRREEVWLAAKYPGYAGYQRRVKKLIPFVY